MVRVDEWNSVAPSWQMMRRRNKVVFSTDRFHPEARCVHKIKINTKALSPNYEISLKTGVIELENSYLFVNNCHSHR